MADGKVFYKTGKEACKSIVETKEWLKRHNRDKRPLLGTIAYTDENINKVKPIGDGEGLFTKGMGMLVNKPKQGFGMRSWRYSMIVENGNIVKVFEEPGKNNSSDDNDPFEVSDAQTILNYLRSHEWSHRNDE